MTAMRALPLLAFVFGLTAFAQPRAPKTLDIYASGESMLVDAGWPGFHGRDADRIGTVLRAAGVKQIDYLITTHFHGDHAGGTPELAERFPIRNFIDHGSTVQQDERNKSIFQSYADARAKGSHTVAKPGDKVPIKGIDVTIIASGTKVLHNALPGGGKPNPSCAGFKFQEGEVIQQEKTGRAEDPQSVSTFITFGNFRTAIMGDLTWNLEHELMCPNNPLGTVDAYLVSHHGADTSGSEALVHALHARAAIMNNGPRKGGAVQTFQILRTSPGLKGVWQNHYSVAGGKEYNTAEPMIANLEEFGVVAQDPAPAGPSHMGAAYWIKLSARSDGSFTITNSRNGLTKSY